MGKDVLIILMIAFGLFAVIMFVLFYAYLKKYHNERIIDDNYEKDIDREQDMEQEEPDEDIIGNRGIDDNMESKPFVPMQEENYQEPSYEENEVSDTYSETDMSEYNVDETEEDEGFVPIRKE